MSLLCFPAGFLYDKLYCWLDPGLGTDCETTALRLTWAATTALLPGWMPIHVLPNLWKTCVSSSFLYCLGSKMEQASTTRLQYFPKLDDLSKC
jgi:hypothetical protein